MNAFSRPFQHLALAAALLLLPGMAQATPLPQLSVFRDGNFEPGAWKIMGLDGGSRVHARSQTQCIGSPDPLIHAGYDNATAGCTHTLVENTPERAVVIYSCRGQGSGRTQIIRDGRNRFTIDAQGVSGAAPFGLRAEYSRIGPCGDR